MSRFDSFENSPFAEYDRRADKYVVSPQKLSMYLTGTESPIIFKAVEQIGKSKPNIFIYDEGYYKETTWNELNRRVKSLMPPELRTSKDVKDVIYELETEAAMRMDEFNSDEDIVNFQNGIFHISTGELTPHTPEVLSTVRIPCNYDASLTLDDAPVFASFLEDLVSGDVADMTFLLEFIGAVISNVPGFRFKKCLILVGQGNTGKSVLRQLVCEIVGPKNCHSIDLARLNDRFASGQLYGKRLGGNGDMSFVRVQEMSTLKNLTGGDDINGEFKGKDAFSYRYSGYLFYNTNELPAFGGDRGRHVYDRFCIVTCNNIVPPEKRDSQLLDKLLSEKDAIAVIALRYLSDAIRRGYKFTEGENMVLTRERYAEQNNSLIVFVNEHCTMGGKTARSEFKRLYLSWCKAEGMYPEANRNIENVLKEYFGIEARKSGVYVYDLTVKDHVHLAYHQ